MTFIAGLQRRSSPVARSTGGKFLVCRAAVRGTLATAKKEGDKEFGKKEAVMKSGSGENNNKEAEEAKFSIKEIGESKDGKW